MFTVYLQELKWFQIAQIYLKHISSTLEHKVIFFYSEGLLRLYFTIIWKLIVTIKAMITSLPCGPTVTISSHLLDHLFTRTLSVSTVLSCPGNELWLRLVMTPKDAPSRSLSVEDNSTLEDSPAGSPLRDFRSIDVYQVTLLQAVS